MPPHSSSGTDISPGNCFFFVHEILKSRIQGLNENINSNVNNLLIAATSLVIRQKGEPQNGCFRKAKQAKLFEKQIFFNLPFPSPDTPFAFLEHLF